MSARANASARARRAGITQPEPTRTQQQSPNAGTQNNAPPPGGLTLQQVIALVDTRLVALETFMKETKEQSPSTTFYSANPVSNGISPNGMTSAQDIPVQSSENPDENVSLDVVLEDFNNRFITLATEISELKDMLLKLQTYTMDVNKSLYEDRMRILSDLGTQDGDAQIFTMSNSSEPISAEIIEPSV